MSEPEWERLRALFEGALQRSPDQRAAFLRERAHGDAHLRGEVESLLVAHAAAAAFLPEPDLPPAGVGSESGDGTTAGGAPRLAPGTRLGTFEIAEPIGAGGMGEVYRARDPRLERFVAIKVLSGGPGAPPRARERFEREARAISRLSNPHICTVHDVGVAEVERCERPFLVMELLDGETLAARLARGPLPVDQALSCALDIADALVAAHAHGIVHRDLKPANVMLTSQGVKLLDFGLAQLRSQDTAAAEAAGGAGALTTSTGLIFGTAPYMAPEQLRGERTDARTDVFAFGVLLHELVTGARPFTADSQAGLIAAILEHDARPVSELQPLAPRRLDRVVRKCLAKHPDDRWQTARDLKSELVWARDGDPDDRRVRASDATRWRWRGPALVSLATAVASLLAFQAWDRTRAPAPPRAVTRFTLPLPPGVTLDIHINSSSFAIAPAGDRIAFVGVTGGRTSLFVHTLDTGSTREVAGTAGAANPMFSPDGHWVAFAVGRTVRKVPAGGGATQLVWNARANQMAWLANGEIVRGGPHPIRLIGDEPRDLTTLGKGEEGHNTPVSLPDGSLLLTIVRAGFQNSLTSIGVWPAGASAARDLLRNATSPKLVGDDAIVFAQGRSLMAAGFDGRSHRLIGEPRALGIELQTTLYSAAPLYALARNGTLVYAPRTAGRRLVWIDRQGHEETMGTDERMYSHFRLSPDGRRVAAYVADADRDLWVFGVDGSPAQKLTTGPARDTMPVWSPDGSHIFFTSAERNIFRVPADRATAPVPVFQLPHPQRLHAMSATPDGRRLLMQWDLAPRQVDLRVLEVGATPSLSPLVSDDGMAEDGTLSADGRWLAYESAESNEGRDGEIVVRPFPDIGAGRWIVSSGAGRQPLWSRDGRELFYRAPDGTVMAVPVRTSPNFSYGKPVAIATPTNTLRDWGTGPTYGVSRDGRRFLLIKAPELEIRALDVVLNWDVEVRTALGRSAP